MANLLGQNIGTNYKGILNLDTINTPLDATLRAVTDGEGNASGLKLSTTDSSFSGNVGIGTNAPTTLLDLRGSLTIQRDTANFTMRLGNLGQINAYIDCNTNNQFYLVDATFSNSFILNNLGTGFGGSPIASTRLAVKGSGTTSATTALLVQNSAGTQIFKVADSGSVQMGLTSGINWTFNSNILSSSQYAYIAGSNGSILTNGNFSGGVHGNGNGGKVCDNGISTAQVASSVLEVSSTTKGFLPPRMTTTQKNAIATPASGLIVYDETTNKLACYNGTTWNDLF